MSVYAALGGAWIGLVVTMFMGATDFATVMFVVGVTWTALLHWIEDVK